MFTMTSLVNVNFFISDHKNLPLLGRAESRWIAARFSPDAGFVSMGGIGDSGTSIVNSFCNA